MRNKILGYILAFLTLFIFWDILARVINSIALPPPYTVIKEFFARFMEDIFPHVTISAFRAVVAIIISTILAVPMGLILGRENILDKIVAPFIFLTYPIPKIVLLPLILLLLGLGESSKIALIGLIVFYQILVTTRDGAKAVSNESIYSIISLGASKIQIYRHVVFPACLPDILTALRVGTGTAIAVLFFVESFATEKGLGFYILDSWGKADYLSMFSGIIAMSLLGVAIYEFLNILEKLVCKWRF